MPANKKNKFKQEKDVLKQTKKQNLKKRQKTANLNAAKKLAKLKGKKEISQQLTNTPFVKHQRAKHQFDPIKWNHGVLLLKNIPHGFYEKQLKKYFEQYGEVTRLRLARSERTGRSKNYAYIEFKYPDVAKIAAESMNNYIMFRQCLKAIYIPPEKQDHDYFKQSVTMQSTKQDGQILETPKTIRAQQHVNAINSPVSAEKAANRAERSQYKLKLLEKKLAKNGVNVDLSDQLYSSGAGQSKAKNGNQRKKESITYENLAEPIQEIEMPKPIWPLPRTRGAYNRDKILVKLAENNATSDEESSDDENYEPTSQEEIKTKAEEMSDKYLDQFLIDSSDYENEDDYTDEMDAKIKKKLKETDESSDDSDEDQCEEQNGEEQSELKISAPHHGTSEEDSSDDEDYQPNSKELAKAEKDFEEDFKEFFGSSDNASEGESNENQSDLNISKPKHENTAGTSDENSSDDGDYQPDSKELAKADEDSDEYLDQFLVDSSDYENEDDYTDEMDSKIKEYLKKKDESSDGDKEQSDLETKNEITINAFADESTDDEDDDYEPTPQELANADRFVEKFLNAESSDEADDNDEVNETIESNDDSDSNEFKIVAIKKAKKAAKKLRKITGSATNSKDTIKTPSKNNVNKKKRRISNEQSTENPAKRIKRTNKQAANKSLVTMATRNKIMVIKPKSNSSIGEAGPSKEINNKKKLVVNRGAIKKKSKTESAKQKGKKKA